MATRIGPNRIGPNTYTTRADCVCLECGQICTASVDRFGQILSECCGGEARDEDGFVMKPNDFIYDPY